MTVFERNLAGMSRHSAGSWQQFLQMSARSDSLEFAKAGNGDWTARCEGKWLSSRVNPREEAKAWISSRGLPDAWGRGGEYGVAGTAVLLGVGLGYTALAAAEALNSSVAIALADPRPEVFLQAMKHVDMKPLWARERVILVFSKKPDEGLSLLAPQGQKWPLCPLVHAPSLASEGGPEWAERWVKLLSQRQAEWKQPSPEEDTEPLWFNELLKAQSRNSWMPS